MKRVSQILWLIIGVLALLFITQSSFQGGNVQAVFLESDFNETIARKVNINDGTKEELESLDGVGSSLAERIISYREEEPFKTIEEIQNVKGIGPQIYEKNKDRIEV